MILIAFGISNFKEYFFNVKNFTQHILFKYLANLAIIGTVSVVLFGKGVHIHSIVDHLFDHGDTHVILHAHPSDHHHTESGSGDLDKEDSHQHPIASVDLSGTLTQSVKKKIVLESNTLALAVPEQVNSVLNNIPPAQLAKPPPDLIQTQYHSYFFSLRAPPMA